jgi:hypothetical protein
MLRPSIGTRYFQQIAEGKDWLSVGRMSTGLIFPLASRLTFIFFCLGC